MWSLSLLSRLPVLYEELIPLPKLRHEVARRHAILTTLDVGGTRLTVIAAHLGHLVHGSPRQMRDLAQRIRRIDGPCVLMGDFNCWGGPLRLMFPMLTDAVRGATWPAWRPHSRIDHILVPRSLAVVESRVEPDAGSDHLPIRCVLSLGQSS